MALQKTWIVKIFGQDGTTLKKSISRKSLRNNPSFRSRINGGFGECVLDLVGSGFAFDNFGEGTWIAHSYIVDLYEVDSVNAPLGRRIYRGYISKYEPYIETGGTEGVKVTCLGLVSLLTKSFYKSGSSFTVTQSSADPQTIGEAVIDHFNTIFGGSLLSYTHGTSTQTVGTTVSYTYTDQKWFDALTTVGKLSGTNWWWKVDENGLFWLQQKPSSATHKFTIRKDISAITAPKDAEKVINDVQVRWGSPATNSDYADSSSQSTYGTGATPSGKWSEVISDSLITDQNGSDQRGNSEIGNKKTAFNSAVITVNPNYDLESIKVGQTCEILNYDSSSTFFSNNLLIVGLTYDGNTCKVEVEAIPKDFGRELQNFIQTSGGSGTVTGSGSSGTGSGGGSSSSSSSGPGFVDRETPSGTIDGSNAGFTISQTPVAGSEHVYLNGVLQNGGGNDYSIAGTIVTFTSAPLTGSILLVSYRTSSGSTNFADKEVPTGTIDGSNATFTLAHTPTTGSEMVYLDGILQNGSGNDYSISSTSITFVTAPPAGYVLLVSYRY